MADILLERAASVARTPCASRRIDICYGAATLARSNIPSPIHQKRVRLGQLAASHGHSAQWGSRTRWGGNLQLSAAAHDRGAPTPGPPPPSAVGNAASVGSGKRPSKPADRLLKAFIGDFREVAGDLQHNSLSLRYVAQTFLAKSLIEIADGNAEDASDL